MDSEGYVKWLRTRLFPTFRKLYFKYNKRSGQVTKAVGMRLVIDRASYHRKVNDKWLLSGKSKPELLALLLELGQRSMVVARTARGQTSTLTLTLAASDTDGKAWLTKASSTSPSAEELKAAIQALLATPVHADKLKSELRLLFEAESLKDSSGQEQHFHQVIFTPTAESRTQPSEHLWAYAKKFVAANFCRGRGLKVLRDQLRVGFYGAGTHAVVDAKFCANIIRHANEYIDKWIANDDVLEGKLLELKGGGDANVVEDLDEVVEAREDDSCFDDAPVPAGHDATQLFCSCQQPYNPDRDMVECDSCKAWFHPDCVGLEDEELERVMAEQEAEWACPECAAAANASAGAAQSLKQARKDPSGADRTSAAAGSHKKPRNN